MERQPGHCLNCQRPMDEHGCHEQAERPTDTPTIAFWQICEHMRAEAGGWGVCQHPDAVRLAARFAMEE